MKSLRMLGLTRYETAIYKALIESGTLNAKEISEISKVPQTAVYPNLNLLMKKQLVQKINSNPSLFEILPIAQSIGNAIKRKQKILEELKEKILVETQELKKAKPEKEKEIIKLTRGKEFSSAIYYEFMKRVKKTFFVMGWRFEKVGERYNLLNEYRSILKKGVDVRIIVTGAHEKNKELVEAYKEAGIKLRYWPADNFSIVVIDEKECKITLKNREFIEKYNLQISDTSLSQALNLYFLDVWEKAREI